MKKINLAVTCLIAGALLAPIVSYSADETDSDRSHPKGVPNDSAVETKIKSKSAAEHMTIMGRIHVDTDADGVEGLSGTVLSQHETHAAISIAVNTEHVAAVKSDLTIRKDD